jgi:8-oxo-dGTP pyrophosphatase MutT (NUDIX family)
MQRSDVIRRLAEYRVRHPHESDTIERFEAFVNGEPDCFQRDCWSGHVTGSAWVVDAHGAHVLLTHHRKLDRWLQLGGHSDGDSDPLRVACREAYEESGLPVEPLSDALFDIDIHLIPARRDDPAHLHFDARFALRVTGGDKNFRVSDESHALRWVRVDRLADVTTEASMLRMAGKWLANRNRYDW